MSSSPPPATTAVDEPQNIQENENNNDNTMDTEVTPTTVTTPKESSITVHNDTEETTIPSTTIKESEITLSETLTEPQTEEPSTESASVEKEENTPQPQYDVITEEYDSNQRQVNDLIASLRLELLTSRSETATLKSKVNKLTVENMDLTIKNKSINSFETANKLQMDQMEERLTNLKQKESEYHQRILELEHEQSLLKDQKQKQYHEHVAETMSLKKERDGFAEKLNKIQLELSKTVAESKSTKAEQKTLERRCNQLELDRMGDAKAHEDLIAIYEKQQKENQLQLEKYIGAEARARQEAIQIEERLQKENDDLKQKLVETEDRLSIIRLRSSNNDGSSPTQQRTTTLPDGRQSNLIQLMRQYEEGGKSWECIYEDYFELKEAHIRAVSHAESMRSTNEQLMREQRDKEQRYRRMEIEHRRLYTETESVRERARRAEAAQEENEKVVATLNDKIQELQRKNNDLDKSLNEVAHQLRYLIQDVESRNELLPPGVKSSSDLIRFATSQDPDFSQEDLVFKNISELQEQNQKLLERIRKLEEQVKEKTHLAEQLRREEVGNKEKYTQTMNEAKDTINELNYNVVTLERR
ncbi:hypothetical protein BDC45DRAFT_71241 [Circinella umbellata]|nr:hypothetical protein BDC45DRAFT_71241 [Circinella umbellata]